MAGGDAGAGEHLRELHSVVDGAGQGGRGGGGLDGGVDADSAAVEVDSGESGAGGMENVVGGPECGGVGVADVFATAAEAGVAFVHAVGSAAGGVAGGVDGGDLRIRDWDLLSAGVARRSCRERLPGPFHKSGW